MILEVKTSDKGDNDSRSLGISTDWKIFVDQQKQTGNERFFERNWSQQNDSYHIKSAGRMGTAVHIER